MRPPYDQVTAVVLAGGQSRRMGQDKRRLEVGGVPLLQRVLSVLEPLFQRRVIVAADRDPWLEAFGLAVWTDIRPGLAALGGLYTALTHSKTERIFAVAADMPCLDARAIALMVERSAQADVAMAALSTGVQPMHAVYGKACLPALERMIEQGNLSIQDLLREPSLRISLVEEVEVRAVDPHLLSFLNINTPADLEMARKLIEPRTHADVPRR